MTTRSKTKMSDIIFITLHSTHGETPIRLNPHGIIYISQCYIYKMNEKRQVIGSEIHLIDGTKMYCAENDDEVYKLIDNLKQKP